LIDEIQRIECTAQGNFTLGSKRGYDNRVFSLSFRGYTSELLWVFDYLDPSTSPLSSLGSGFTLLERLLSLPSLSNVTLSSNSTTGRICPSLLDIDKNGNALKFVTDITFIGTTSQSLNELKITNSASGNVPPLVLTKDVLFPPDIPMVINGTTSKYTVTPHLSAGMEVRTGSAPFIQDVQILTMILEDEYAASSGLYFLTFGNNSWPLPVGLRSTTIELSQAINSLLQIHNSFEGETVNVVVSNSSITQITGFRSLTVIWTVTFPSDLGKASLLNLIETKNMTGLTITARRVVEGFNPSILTGEITLRIPIGIDLSYYASVLRSKVSNTVLSCYLI
jgi:hypothetical protein